MVNPNQSSQVGDLDLDVFEMTEKCRQKILISQIITVVLVGGASFFLLFALWIQNAALNGAPSIVNWGAIVFAVMAFGGSLLIPDLTATAAIRQIDQGEFTTLDNEGRFLKLAPIFQARHIVSSALIEGAAYLNIFAYFFEPFVGNLITVAALLALLIIKFPTVNASRDWIARAARSVGESLGRE